MGVQGSEGVTGGRGGRREENRREMGGEVVPGLCGDGRGSRGRGGRVGRRGAGRQRLQFPANPPAFYPPVELWP